MKNIVFTSAFVFILICVSPVFSQTFNELIVNYNKALKDKDYDEVIEVLNTMLKKYPKNQPEVTYFNRGNAYRYLREYKDAISDYSNSIKIKTDYTDAYYNRGVCYFRLEEFEKSVSDFTEVIKSNPTYPNVYFNRGNAYSGLYKYDDAVADYTKAIELNPDYTDAYYNRGNKYYGLEMYNEAIEDWKMVIKLDPAYKSAIQEKIDEAKSKIKKK